MDSKESTNNSDNNTAGTLWFDQSSLGPKDMTVADEPEVTREEIITWIGKYADSEIFEIRNLNTTRHEAEAQRIRKYQQYIRDNLR